VSAPQKSLIGERYTPLCSPQFLTSNFANTRSHLALSWHSRQEPQVQRTKCWRGGRGALTPTLLPSVVNSIRLLRIVTTEARIPAGTANSDICRSRGEIWICATTGSRDCRSPPAFRYRPQSRMLHVAASPDRIQTSSCGSPTGKAGVQMADGNCTPGC